MDISIIQKDRLKQAVRIKTAIAAILNLTLFLASNSSLAGDYLDELAVEAEATAAVSKTNQLSPEERKQFQEMEALLKTEKPSTFKYYVKLRTSNKERAFETFANDTSRQEDRLHHLQKKVMDLYFTQ